MSNSARTSLDNLIEFFVQFQFRFAAHKNFYLIWEFEERELTLSFTDITKYICLKSRA